MKIKKPNIKPETVVSIALGVLGVAQVLLTNKKDANDRAAMKAELKEDLMKDLLGKESN